MHTGVAVLLNDGAGGFAPPTFFDVSGSGTIGAVVGDFNADGNLDIATAKHSDSAVAVLLGDGTGGFGTAVSYPVDSGPLSVAVGDFNGDDNLDLATANN